MKYFMVLWFLSLWFTTAQGQTTKIWKQYVSDIENQRAPILPNFSFAGYRYSEVAIPKVNHKSFFVNEYGATPNDGKSDKKAIIKAIRAAEANGSGIVHFSSGRYIVNAMDDDLTPIEIRASNIVLRGQGADSTTLFFERDLPAKSPEKLYSSPYAIKTVIDRENHIITDVVSDVVPESARLTVKDASSIKVGDWVILEVLNNDPDLIKSELGGMSLEPNWTSLIDSGVKVNERHQVAKIDGEQLTFAEPIHFEVKAKHGWRLREFHHLEEVGFEGLTFEGAWLTKFIHHKSAKHDGGWSIIKLDKVVNSWIKDSVFRNVNRPATIKGSAATTVLNVRIEGNSGHQAINASGGSTGILIAGADDLSGMWHSFGVAGGSTAGTVVWRSTMAPHTSFEMHSSQPRATLFDRVSGGLRTGRAGGAVKNLPNHGKHLVLWNFEETDEAEENFGFVSKESKWWRVVPPIIVGFHGAGTTFNESELQILESHGQIVSPDSLFEAQLAHRLGQLPSWISEFKNNRLAVAKAADTCEVLGPSATKLTDQCLVHCGCTQ